MVEVRDRIPGDIYRQCVAIAGSYYSMLKRRRELEEQILCGSPRSDGQPKGSGTGDPTARKAERLVIAKERNEWKIRAVEQAWCRMVDEMDRDFIKQNVFEHKFMKEIDLPMSERTMQRKRHQFMRYLAEEMGEIL